MHLYACRRRGADDTADGPHRGRRARRRDAPSPLPFAIDCQPRAPLRDESWSVIAGLNVRAPSVERERRIADAPSSL